jgi:hypothetical protein
VSAAPKAKVQALTFAVARRLVLGEYAFAIASRFSNGDRSIVTAFRRLVGRRPQMIQKAFGRSLGGQGDALHEMRERKHHGQEVLRHVWQPAIQPLFEVRGRKRSLVCIL